MEAVPIPGIQPLHGVATYAQACQPGGAECPNPIAAEAVPGLAGCLVRSPDGSRKREPAQRRFLWRSYFQADYKSLLSVRSLDSVFAAGRLAQWLARLVYTE